MRNPTWRGGLLLAMLGWASSLSAAADPMRYIYDAAESSLDRRYVYPWKILETALERTKDAFGPYVIEPSVVMTEKRQAFELRHPSGKLTVMYLDTNPEFERDLIAIHLPVDKGLVGYRVCLIRKED